MIMIDVIRTGPWRGITSRTRLRLSSLEIFAQCQFQPRRALVAGGFCRGLSAVLDTLCHCRPAHSRRGPVLATSGAYFIDRAGQQPLPALARFLPLWQGSPRLVAPFSAD